jgi:hypothetical protein
VDKRLIPLNGALALLAKGVGWPNDLTQQGFRLHLLEGDVQSEPQSVRADVIAYRTDPDLILLLECKGGRNVNAAQARGYINAQPAGLLRRGTMPAPLRDHDPVTVQAVFVGHEQWGDALAESMARESIEAPLLLVGPTGARLTGALAVSGLDDFDSRDPRHGHPPSLILVDHESPVEEIRELLFQQIMVAMAQGAEAVDLRQAASAIHSFWHQVSRPAQDQFLGQMKAAAQSLAAGDSDVMYESNNSISPRLVLRAKPAEADPRGAPQAWQGVARRATKTLGRSASTEIKGQISMAFDDLASAADTPLDDQTDDGLDS